MQLCNPQFCRFLPFVFLLFRCITSDLSGNDDDDDTQPIPSPLPDGLKVGKGGQVWSSDRLFDTNAPTPLLVATEQTDDACPLPPTKEDSQRRKVRRGVACTAPLQLKPGTNTETKPRPGNHDGAWETPLNPISPSSGLLFEWPSWIWPSWTAPNVQPTTPKPCPNVLMRFPICSRRLVDEYQNTAEELRDALPYTVPCSQKYVLWCCAMVEPGMRRVGDGFTLGAAGRRVLSYTKVGIGCFFIVFTMVIACGGQS